MTIAIGILLSIFTILILRQFVVPHFMVGENLFKTKVTADEGFKRIQYSSAFVAVGVLLASFLIYLYVWRSIIPQTMESIFQVMEIPEALRLMLFKLKVYHLAIGALALSVVFLIGLKVAENRKRKVIVNTKGIAIDGAIVLWSEMEKLIVNEQRLSFTTKQIYHHYSWNLNTFQFHRLTNMLKIY